MNKLRIVLGDDHSLILEGLTRLLEKHYDVVAAARDGQSVVKTALQLTPDLVVLDINMPILNGIDAGREIKHSLPDTKLVFLSMYSNPIYLRKALEAGASAYVLKTGATEELLSAIDVAMRDGCYVSPGFGREIVDNTHYAPEVSKRAVIELTSRQRQILQLVAEGKHNKEIAEILHISVKTVEFHRGRLMEKLGVHSVADLTRFAIQEGLTGNPHSQN
jgi:DNA-binding NarL/FixJ family response regulator